MTSGLGSAQLHAGTLRDPVKTENSVLLPRGSSPITLTVLALSRPEEVLLGFSRHRPHSHSSDTL